jgi:flagellar hook-length control protein FliK
MPTSPHAPRLDADDHTTAAPVSSVVDAADAPSIESAEQVAGEPARLALADAATSAEEAAPVDVRRARAAAPRMNRVAEEPGVVPEPSATPEPAIESRVSDAARAIVAQASAMDPASAEAAAGVKSAAARLARALERAAESGAVQIGEAVDVQTGQESGQHGDAGPSFGEWLRRELLPAAASGRVQTLASPVFALSGTAPQEAGAAALAEALSSGRAPAMPPDRDLAAQLVQSLRVQFRDGIGEAVLKLKPEHLGAVSISMRIENGGIKANVQADVAAVRQWLESQQDLLRQGLAEHGLRLDRFVVDPDGQRDRSSRQNEEARPQRRPPRRPVQNEQPVFEVVV